MAGEADDDGMGLARPRPWFEGKGNIRKWAGYGLAHRLLAEHLSREPELEAAALVHISAEALRPAMRRLSGAPEAEPEAPTQEPSGETPGKEFAPQPGAESQAPAEEAPGTDTLLAREGFARSLGRRTFAASLSQLRRGR